jgi:hypothetical protein
MAQHYHNSPARLMKSEAYNFFASNICLAKHFAVDFVGS